jgi:hypothetical protein
MTRDQSDEPDGQGPGINAHCNDSNDAVTLPAVNRQNERLKDVENKVCGL